jgi:hypothetical protein
MELHESWVGVGLAAVAMIGTGVSAWMNRNAARDKLEFDAKYVELQAHYQTCEAEMEANRSRYAAMSAELNDCREQHRASEIDRRELWKILNDIRAQLKPS